MNNGWNKATRHQTLAIGLSLCLLGIASAIAAVPEISSFSPIQGPAGTPVRIQGEGFSTTSDVLIGTKPAVYQILSDQFILATVPREASTGVIQIVTSSGIAVSSTPFTGAPFIEKLNPEFGAPNDSIIIFGRNLGNATDVFFGDDPATFLVLGDTQLSARVPNTVGLKTIKVTTPVAEASSEIFFEATGQVPFVREFMPEFGSPGTRVTVNGKNLIGTSSFLFGTIAASFVVTADTQLQLTIPVDAPSGPVTLKNGFGESTSRVNFLVIGTTPFVEEIIPDVASPGDLVTIEGINFTGTTAIHFGEASAAFSVTADTQIQVTIPEEATSGMPRFESINGDSVSSVPFTINAPAPFIEDFEPVSVTAGQLVRINGRNFSGVSDILVGEEQVDFAVVADNQISMTAPIQPTSGLITLTNPGGITSSTNQLVVTGAEPSISMLDPNAGRPGDLIMIEGGNFATTTNVWFGNFQAEFSIIANNQLQAVVPNDATTGPVSVANLGGRVTSIDPFFLPVRIDAIDPQIGTPGDTIEISGANFTGSSEIQFGTIVGMIEETTALTMKAIIPDDARIGTLAITNPAGITGSLQVFEIQPTLESFRPVAAPVGSTITLTGKGLTEVTSVQFGTVPAAFDVLSSSEIATKVPVNSPAGKITLSNPSASATSLETFLVVESADLSIETASFPAQPTWPANYTYQIKVTSAGPSTLANGRFTTQLPPGSIIRSQVNSHGGCDVTDGLATCTLVNLGATETAVIEFLIEPEFYGHFDSQSVLSSPIFDPSEEDHETMLSLVISGPAPTLSIIRNEEDPTLITWTRAASNFVLETAPRLGSDATWLPAEGPFERLNDRLSLSLPDDSETLFFRLRNTTATSN